MIIIRIGEKQKLKQKLKLKLDQTTIIYFTFPNDILITGFVVWRTQCKHQIQVSMFRMRFQRIRDLVSWKAWKYQM